MSFTDDFLKGLNKRNVSLGEINSKNVSVDLGSDDFTKSFLSGLEKRKKKKEEEELAIIRHDLFGDSSIKTRASDDDIAPVKEDSLLDFFQKGSFEDGFDWSDIPTAILGTAGDVGLNVVRGAGNMLEGIADTISYGIAGVADAMGNEELAERGRKGAQRGLINEWTQGADDYLNQYSVLGRTSDAIAQGIGQVGTILLTGGLGQAAGLGAAGVTALTTGTMGLSGMGSGMSQAYQEGATDEEAVQYGMIAGAADALSELMFGGLGKAVNATGLSTGVLGGVDDILAKKVSNLFSSQIAKNFAEFGIKASAEGLEEVVAGIAQAMGKKLTYMSEEEFSSILKDENLLEQFVVGMATSGIAQTQGLHIANKTNTDFITGQTRNEQAVVEKEVEKRIAEAEKDGKKLTGKQKSDIQEQVEKDMEKGYISTDTIEETLGGETWQRYKDTVDKENALEEKLKAVQEEFDTLNQMKQGEMTGEQIDRRNDLKLELQKMKETVESEKNHSIRDHLKQELGKQVSEMVRSDRLIESYNEKTRRTQAYQADLKKYDAKQRAVIENAQKSGILNNTNRTHEFVDMVAKIAADKGVLFDFTNNAKLKESGFAVEGKAVNGYVTKDGITVNIQSPKALNSTVGHEITHVLEGTDLYTELQNSVIEYAKTKGEYQGRFDALTKLYENVEGADINAELTADLVGDYLFTDENFIQNLSVNNRNVFQKIYDEVKYLVKVATAGSKEARELERVKRIFENAYRESTKAQSDTKLSIAEIVDENQKSYGTGVHLDSTLLDNLSPEERVGMVKEYVKELGGESFTAYDPNGNSVEVRIAEAREKFKNKSGKMVPVNKDLTNKYIGNEVKQEAIALVDELIVTSEFDGSKAPNYPHGWLDNNGQNNWEYWKTYIQDKNNTIWEATLNVANSADGEKILYDISPIKKVGRSIKLDTLPTADNVAQNSENVKLSLSDSEGRQLSNEQSEYFKDSAVRDKDGNLMVLYHGTQNDFTVFDIARSGENYEGGWSEYGEGIYLTPDKKTAEYYGDNAGRGREVKLMEVYANIKSLFNVNDPVDFDISDLVQKYELTEFDERHIKRAGDRLINFLQHHNESVRDYLTGKGYDGIWEKGLNGDVYQVVAYAESQIKNTDNAKPTENPDIRYSLSEDSEGRKLNPAIAKRFSNSKAVDENGNLLTLYHGTASGEFSIFDKTKGNVEGDFGSGFYFTNDAYDVEENYEGGGPDFDNKVARLAEQIEQEEDIDYDEAEERAKAELFKGSHLFEVYLNIENPAVVGDTMLFDNERYMEQYNEEDFDDYDEYIAEVEQLLADDIENIVWEVEKNVDVYSTDGLADVLYEAYYEGGIGIEELKRKINDLYLEDSNGNLVGNEVTRQIIESLGYDGIIDPTVSSKFNMGLDESTTHYIVFKPNQIKAVTNENPTDNPDIHKSLSDVGEARQTYGNYNVYGSDVALEAEEEIAPVAVSETENTTPATVSKAERVEVFPDEIAPDMELERLIQDKNRLESAMQEAFASGDDKALESIGTEYGEVMERISSLESEIAETEEGRLGSIQDTDAPPEMEAPYYEDIAPVQPENPMADRNIEDVGNRKVKAYMYENPEVKPFFQAEARVMLGDLGESVKGEKLYNDQLYYESGGEKGWSGVRRQTTSEIADLLDNYGYTYAQIEKGLNAIIEDNGKENNAVSKRIEFALNDRLRNGYTNVWGEEMPPDQDYIRLLQEKEITEYSQEAFESFMATADQYAPEDIAPVFAPVKATAEESKVVEDIAPTYDVTGKKGVVDGQQAFLPDAGVEPKLTRKLLHQNIVDRVKNTFHVRGFEFDDVLKQAKDLSTFATVDNTPQRVMEKALGYKQGQILSDLTVNKVAQNETEGIKWLNSFTDRKNGLLAQISKQYNIKPGSKQSAAAQMYAEGFYVGENDEIIAYGDRELAADFPDPKVRNNIRGLANDPRIREIYDQTLAEINESRSRNAYPEIPRLDNYFLHFRAMEDTFSRLGLPFNPNDIRAKDLPTDLNGVTADLKPGQPYFASAMHRTGKRTSFDLLGGLEKYLTSAKNQIYHIDDIQTLRALRNYVAEQYGQATGLENLNEMSDEEAAQRIEAVYDSHLSTFAKFLNEEANVLAGKTALIDRGLEGIIGRRGITFLDTLNRQVGSNMVGYNISSSLTNFIAPVQALAKSNKADFVKGFAQTAANKVGSIFGRGDSFAEESPVMIRRKGAERFYRTPWQKLSDPGYILMGAVDDISTELIARAKYNEFTRHGMDSQTAHIETDKWVSRLMGDRSLGQQPQLYNSKMLGIITKFQLEVRNQLDSQFYDTIQEAKASTEEIENALTRNAKKAAKITSTFVQLAVAQHLFGKAFESIAGYNPAFDIIEAIIKAFGWDDDEEDEDTVLDNIEQGFFELMGDMPYVSTMTGGRIPLESALPIKELYKGEDQYGNEKSVLKAGDTAYYNSVVKHSLRAMGDKPASIYGIVFMPF